PGGRGGQRGEPPSRYPPRALQDRTDRPHDPRRAWPDRRGRRTRKTDRPRREQVREGAAACAPSPSPECGYGVGSVTLTLKMSELPKFGAQFCCGAGRGTVVSPVRRAMRHASIAAQSAAARVSFQTAAPYVFVATA